MIPTCLDSNDSNVTVIDLYVNVMRKRKLGDSYLHLFLITLGDGLPSGFATL